MEEEILSDEEMVWALRIEQHHKNMCRKDYQGDDISIDNIIDAERERASQ